MGNVGCYTFLVLEKGSAPYVGFVPESAILFFRSLLTLSEHLIYIYNEYKCALHLNDFPRHMLDTFVCAQGMLMCGP